MSDLGGSRRSAPDRFVVLDGMRGVAAVAVLLLHLGTLFGLAYIPRLAHLSVDFFFLLSGFVVAHAYEARLKAGMPLPDFVRVRLVRLYPMVLLGGAFGAVALIGRMLLFHDLEPTAVAAAILCGLLLIPTTVLGSFRSYAFPLNSPFWSLSAELLVNFAYAIFAPRLSTVALALVTAVGVVALGAAAVSFNGLDVGFFWNEYGVGLLRAAVLFPLGVLIQRLHLGSRRSGGWAKLLPAALLLLLAPAQSGAFIELAIVLLGFPLLVALGAGADVGGRVGRFWSGLGDLSYPVYAIHYPLVVIAANAATKLGVTAPAARLGVAALTGAGVLLTASVALRVYDGPVRAWLRRVLSSRRGARVN